jgi:hypothetical protein
MAQQPRALARAELEANRLALATLVRQVEGSASLVPKGASPGWRGPASAAFHLASTGLRRELDAAVELLRAAERYTAAAIHELETHA